MFKLNTAFYINIFFAAKKMHHGLYFYEDHLKKIFNWPGGIHDCLLARYWNKRRFFFHTSMILVFLKKSDCHPPSTHIYNPSPMHTHPAKRKS